MFCDLLYLLRGFLVCIYYDLSFGFFFDNDLIFLI